MKSLSEAYTAAMAFDEHKALGMWREEGDSDYSYDYTSGAKAEAARRAQVDECVAKEVIKALELIGAVDMPSAADKTAWIVMCELMGAKAREALAALRKAVEGMGK